jgi:GAF domain-containing protein
MRTPEGLDQLLSSENKTYAKAAEMESLISQKELVYVTDMDECNQMLMRYLQKHPDIAEDSFIEKLGKFSTTLRQHKVTAWESYLDPDGSARTEILDKAMKAIHNVMQCQCCALFIMDKKGTLARQGFYALDHLGNQINPKWFSDEEYNASPNSFVGRTAMVDPGSKYGTIQYTHNLENDNKTNPTSLKKYQDRFKCPLRRAIAVPINSKEGTIGVLRVIYSDDQISMDYRDVMWLSIFALQIKVTLIEYERTFNRRLFSTILGEVCKQHDLSNPHSGLNLAEVINHTMNTLVHSDSNPFVFGIVRLIDDRCQLLVAAKSSIADCFYQKRNDRPIRRSERSSFVNIVLNQLRPVFIGDATADLKQFHNREWVRYHKFLSFWCFPLICRGYRLGTLSLYSLRKTTYDLSVEEYLHVFTESLSLFVYLTFFDKANQTAILPDPTNRLQLPISPERIDPKTSTRGSMGTNESKHYDKASYTAFISYAEDDKNFARDVAKALASNGFEVIFDEYLRADQAPPRLQDIFSSIYKKAHICVVICSKSYCASQWSQAELASLIAHAKNQPSFTVLTLAFKSVRLPASLELYERVVYPETSSRAIAELAKQLVVKLPPRQEEKDVNAFHVIPRDARWCVRRHGKAQELSTHETQQEALAAARVQALRIPDSEILIHSRDGRILTREKPH